MGVFVPHTVQVVPRLFCSVDPDDAAAAVFGGDRAAFARWASLRNRLSKSLGTTESSTNDGDNTGL